jgi:ketosteroid isomerase-like protein
MSAQRHFPPDILEAIRDGKILGIRAGTQPHRIIGIWAEVRPGFQPPAVAGHHHGAGASVIRRFGGPFRMSVLASILLFSALAAPSETILDLEQRLTAALLSRDEAAFGSLLAEDLVHIGFEGQIVGKTEYMSFFKTGSWRYSRYSPSDLTVKLFQDTALVTGKVDRSIVVNERETTGAFAFTHVWVRSGDGWRLSSSHVTTIAGSG